jgi:hypothetical protein
MTTRLPALPLHWSPREPPLPPAAALAVADAVPTLAAATLAGRLAGRPLLAAADGDVLLVLGDDLPWAEPVTWLGWATPAHDLLLPTTTGPDVPVDLLSAVLRARFGVGVAALTAQRLVVLDRPQLPADLDLLARLANPQADPEATHGGTR